MLTVSLLALAWLGADLSSGSEVHPTAADVVPMQPLPLPVGAPAPAKTAPRPEDWWTRLFRGEIFRRRNSTNMTSVSGRELFRARPDVPSDDLLISRCRALLYHDPELRESNVQVTSQQGVVELSGHVSSNDLKRRAQQIAQKTEGAREVRNRLIARDEARWTSHPPVLLAPPRADGDSLNGASARRDLAPPIPAVGTSNGYPSPDEIVPGVPERIRPGAGRAVVTTYWARRSEEFDDRSPPSAGVVLRAPRNPSDNIHVAKPPIVSLPREDAPIAHGRTGRRIIPAPSRLPSADAATGSRGPVEPTIAVAPTSHFFRATPPTATSIPLTARDDVSAPREPLTRPDIESVLKGSPRLSRLRYALGDRELRLRGEIATFTELYAISRQLGELPGIDLVSFDDVRVAP